MRRSMKPTSLDYLYDSDFIRDEELQGRNPRKHWTLGEISEMFNAGLIGA